MSDTDTDMEHGYLLRSSAIHIRNIVTKQEFVERKQPPCPKLEKKRRSLSIQVVRQTARPVGLKGYLSPRYNPDLNMTYLQQTFLRISKVGEGSYGAVYSVISKDDKKMYAVKIVKRYRPPNPLAEINILDKIDGIVHCMGYKNAWMENNVLYIQLELAATSLHSYSYKKLDIEEEELYQILIDILFALKGMHSIGLLHMDIKPDNILQRSSGRFILCDFGLSTFYNKGTQLDKPSEGDSKYVSTDMLRGDISPAGDIFALGITMFEVGHGIVLPEYGSEWHTYRKGRDLILPKRVRSLSPELSSIISWMMRKDPSQRPSADTLLKHPTLQKHLAYEKTAEDIIKWRQLTWLDEKTLSHYVHNEPLDRKLTKYTASVGQLEEYATNGGRKSWGWTFPDEIETSGKTDKKEPSKRNHMMIVESINCEVDDFFLSSDDTAETKTSSDTNKSQTVATGSASNEQTCQFGSLLNMKQESNEFAEHTASNLDQTETNDFLDFLLKSEPSSSTKTIKSENPFASLFEGSNSTTKTKTSMSNFNTPEQSNINIENRPSTSKQMCIDTASPRTPEKRKRILEEVDEFFSERIHSLSPLTAEAIIHRIRAKCGRRDEYVNSSRMSIEQPTSPKTPAKTLLKDVTNYPSGGSPRKRRVARQLNLNEEPIKTPKREPSESPRSRCDITNVRLNFDEVSESEDKYIEMLINN